MLTLGCAHKEQLVDPTAEENVPPGHAAHAAELALGAKLPGSQGVQLADVLDAENWPGLHTVRTPDVQAQPAPQGMQWVLLLYAPSAQA